MSDLPIVSVVVLSHRFDMALDAMRSVKAQSYPEDHVQLRLHHELPYYPEKFNDAARGCRGKYLIFLPDDDTLEPEFITETVAEAERTNADAVITDHYVAGPLRLRWIMPMFDAEVLRMHAIPWITFLIRAGTFWTLPNGADAQIGGWDGTLFHADWDMGIRLYQAKAKVVQLHRFLWNRTDHRNAASRMTTEAEGVDAMRALRDKHAWMTTNPLTTGAR